MLKSERDVAGLMSMSMSRASQVRSDQGLVVLLGGTNSQTISRKQVANSI